VVRKKKLLYSARRRSLDRGSKVSVIAVKVRQGMWTT
jgi:hypothetical protein